MQVSVVFVVLGLCGAFAAPLSSISENVVGDWIMIPDENMNLHLVNVKDVEFQMALANRGSFDVVFRLYTKQNPKDGEILVPGDAEALAKTNFNPANPTRIVSHGWGGTANSNTIRTCRDAYLARGEFNIIGVDWSKGADSKNYIKARGNVNEAARQVAALADFLAANGMQFNNLYLIGHSLGAHVVGMTAKMVKGGKVNTIFGLDPAMPLFFENKPAERLAVGDAEYVQTIQTNAGVLGFDVPIGDASFYPNWGGDQPGCGIDIAGTCAHYRSWAYLGESIKEVPDEYIGVKCDNGYKSIKEKNCPYQGISAPMGGQPSNHNIVGVFYLPTNKDAPYAMGKTFFSK